MRTVLGPALLHKQILRRTSLLFIEPLELWCVAGLAPLAPQPPAIICLLYCEAVNESTTALLSVPSISEASALAFCCVIYATLLPKMSFLSPTAPSACERVWHLGVFINFENAFACFCHSLCLVSEFPPCDLFVLQNLLLFHFPRLSLSGLNTSGFTCSFCLYQFPFSFVLILLYKRISWGNILYRVTLYCTLDTCELRIFSVFCSFSSIVHLNITVRIPVWYIDEPISLDLSQLRCRC